MKRFLSLLMLVASSLVVTAQCSNYTCTNTQTVTGTVTNQSYNGSVCFKTTTSAVLTNSVNWNNWNFLSFDGDITVQQSVNLNSTSNRVYTSGPVNLSYVSMSGSDTLFTKTGTTIGTLVSNNSIGSTRNYIYTSSRIQVAGVYYYPGDTIITAGGTGNNVVVRQCNSSVLPISLFILSGSLLQWESDDEITRLQTSVDSGRSWTTIASSPKGIYRVQPCSKTQLFRLITYLQTSYTISVPGSYIPLSYKYYNFAGQQITEPVKGGYLKVYSNGTVEKLYKL